MDILFSSILKMSISMSVIILVFYLLNVLWANSYCARLQYLMWIVIFVSLLVPFKPKIEIPISIPYVEQIQQANLLEKSEKESYSSPISIEPGSVSGSTAIESSEFRQAITFEREFFLSLVIPIWLLVAVLILMYHFVCYKRFSKTVHRWSTDVTDSELIALYENIAKEMKLGTIPKIKYFKFISSPMLIGFLKPVVLLPTVIVPKDELSLILRHELVHYKYGDLWIKLITIVSMALNWFNPFVYLAFQAAQSACEMACDEIVMKNTGNTKKKNYIDAIMGAVSQQSQLKVSLSTYFYGGRAHV